MRILLIIKVNLISGYDVVFSFPVLKQFMCVVNYLILIIHNYYLYINY